MNIAILGTGIVGNAIGTKLIQLGHSVRTCSRTVMNEKASAWVKANAKVLEILQTWFGWKSVIDLVEDSLRRHYQCPRYRNALADVDSLVWKISITEF